MNAVEIIVPVSLFLMVVGIVGISVWGGVQSKREMHETLRRAIDAGRPLPPDAINALQKPMRSAQQDLRSGVVLTMLALGMAVAGGLSIAGIILDEGNGGGFFIAALVIGSIGVGQLIAAWLRRDREA